MNFFDILSKALVPSMVLIIIIYGYIKKIDIYSCFIEGAKEGFKTSMRIMPYLIAIFVAIGIFKASKAMDTITHMLSPITKITGIPKQIFPLIFIRPISGSGALAVVKDVIETLGPDSLQGRIASVMMGSSETIFYTIAVYFGSIGVKKHRYTVKAALISYIVSILVSVFVCNVFFY